MDFSNSIPVALTIAIVQAIKLADKDDRFAKYYSLIAIIVGLATGALFSTRQDNVLTLLQDAVQNAAYSALAWATKLSLIHI